MGCVAVEIDNEVFVIPFVPVCVTFLAGLYDPVPVLVLVVVGTARRTKTEGVPVMQLDIDVSLSLGNGAVA